MNLNRDSIAHHPGGQMWQIRKILDGLIIDAPSLPAEKDAANQPSARSSGIPRIIRKTGFRSLWRRTNIVYEWRVNRSELRERGLRPPTCRMARIRQKKRHAIPVSRLGTEVRPSPQRICSAHQREPATLIVPGARWCDSQRDYRHAIDEFVEWYGSESRLAFSKTWSFGTECTWSIRAGKNATGQ